MKTYEEFVLNCLALYRELKMLSNLTEIKLLKFEKLQIPINSLISVKIF